MLKENKIILIEDHPDHAELITEALMDGDSENDIILARDGMEAIDCFQELSSKRNGQMEHSVKLIILDLNLPKISGMDILKFLKKNPMYSKIPVVILSTDSDKTIIDEAFNYGVDEFVTKPLSYDEFIGNLRSLKKYY